MGNSALHNACCGGLISAVQLMLSDERFTEINAMNDVSDNDIV